MIARIWRARATPAHADDYAAYFQESVVPDLRAIHGYQGATLLRRERDGAVDLTLITWWESLDAVRAFAGEGVETAVVHDSAARMLLEFDRTVTHHEVVFRHGPSASRQA